MMMSGNIFERLSAFKTCGIKPRTHITIPKIAGAMPIVEASGEEVICQADCRANKILREDPPDWNQLEKTCGKHPSFAKVRRPHNIHMALFKVWLNCGSDEKPITNPVEPESKKNKRRKYWPTVERGAVPNVPPTTKLWDG